MRNGTLQALSCHCLQNYYPFAVAQLQQPGFAAVSTPTHTRNQPAGTDFLDIGNFARERVNLTTIGADGKYALNSTAFMSRGYSLWRVLRRMEMENVDTAYLGWISYAMHIESRQASLAAMTAHAPVTSVLAPTHPPTVLSQVCTLPASYPALSAAPSASNDTCADMGAGGVWLTQCARMR